ncbi:MAG: hypothetical protein H7269_13760 [Cellulomonas sp.]|nr:hypothetical protein [Cellulomonas sp.]
MRSRPLRAAILTTPGGFTEFLVCAVALIAILLRRVLAGPDIEATL